MAVRNSIHEQLLGFQSTWGPGALIKTDFAKRRIKKGVFMKFKSVIALALLVVSAKSFASSTVTLSNSFWISAFQTKSVSFQKAYVETITVQAEGRYQDSMIEVWANGKPKGSLYVPGRDPNYIVTIRESISSLEFRSVSGGQVNIIQVTGLGVKAPSHGHRPSLGHGYDSNRAQQVASDMKSVINEMKKGMTPKQQDQYLMPLRKSASKLYAIASANSPYSNTVYLALQDLLTKIQNAEAALDTHIETDNGEDSVTDVYTIKETIKAMMN